MFSDQLWAFTCVFQPAEKADLYLFIYVFIYFLVGGWWLSLCLNGWWVVGWSQQGERTLSLHQHPSLHLRIRDIRVAVTGTADKH